MLFVTTVGALNLFLYCYYGKCATEYYVAYADCLYESQWTVLPAGLQKSFSHMIIYAQMPLYYHGYGLVNLNLELFCKVCF